MTPGEGKIPTAAASASVSHPVTFQERQHRRRLAQQRHVDLKPWQLTSRGVGQSTCVGIGGDPVNGTSHLDVIKLFNADPETTGIIIDRRNRRQREEEAAEWIAKELQSRSLDIAGTTAPPGRRMGPRRRDCQRRQRHGRRRRSPRSKLLASVWLPPERRMADTLLKMM